MKSIILKFFYNLFYQYLYILDILRDKNYYNSFVKKVIQFYWNSF